MEVTFGMGVLTMNRTDLLIRLIKSIDFDLNVLIIGFQAPTDDVVSVITTKVKNNTYIKDLKTIIFDFNVGVSFGWNRIIEISGDLDYLIVPGDDIVFRPGCLNNINEYMKNNLSNVRTCVKITDDIAPIKKSSYACFIWTSRSKEKFGFFDENFYPAYFEDNDHDRHMNLLNEPFYVIENAFVGHGDSEHKFSCTLFGFEKTNPEYREKMGICFRKNREFFKIKWGFDCKSPTNKTHYTIPFNGNKDLTKKAQMLYWRNENIAILNS